MEMKTLLDAIENHRRAAPDRPAILLAKNGAWQQFTYADLGDEAARWAAYWTSAGVAAGSVVFIILQHCMEMYPAFLGAMRAGLTPSFLAFPTPKQDPALYWRGHRELFGRVKPSAVLTYAELVPSLRAIADPGSCAVLDVARAMAHEAQPITRHGATRPEQVAVLQHSSGTTGMKKGVALTYGQIARQITAYAKAIEATPEDRIISWLPVYHDMGLIATFLMPLTVGAMVISLDAFEWLTRPDMFLDEIGRFGATLCWLPNFAFNHLVRTRDRDKVYDLSSMRMFINCSEPCKPETTKLFEETFASHGLRPTGIQTSYGMAEAVFAMTQSALDKKPRTISVDRVALTDRSEVVVVDPAEPQALKFLSCGGTVPGAEIRIVPRNEPTTFTRLARAAEVGLRLRKPGGIPVGEIQVRCPYLFEGYFRNPDLTLAAFDGDWFKSGDVGFMLDGELYVCGRLKEMLIVHGRNFYANDIEAIVNAVPGVKPGRVVAVGVYEPSTASEEAVVMAETILTDEAARVALANDIRRAVFDALNLAVRHVEIAPEATLIKTTSGKISRDENIKRLRKETVTS